LLMSNSKGEEKNTSNLGNIDDGLFSKINKAMPIPVGVFDLESRRFVYANEVMTQIYLGEMGGVTEKDLLSAIHHEDISLIKDHFIRLEDLGDDGNLEVLFRVKNGTGWRWLLNSSVVFQRTDGMVKQALLVAKDITDNVDAKDKLGYLNRQLEYFKHATDQAAIVSVSDPSGRIVMANEKFVEISQYSIEELLGKDHRVINSGYHSKDFMADLWATISSGNTWKGVIRNKARDGSYYWVDTTIVPFKGTQGNIEQYLSIRYDITNHIDIKEKLARQNRELDEFAYVVSHDLKAPLRAIYNLVDWIQEDLADGHDETKENLALLKNTAVRLDSLIMGILQYSRVGRDRIHTENVNIGEMVNEIVESVYDATPFEIKREVELPTICTYRVLVHQLFSNLISNAVKHNDKEVKRVIITYHECDDFHHFGINDNGPGIPEYQHDIIFQIFQTLGRNKNPDSTGIGLSIVKKIITELNGDIEIVSDPKKGGCTFQFSIKKIKMIGKDLG